MKKLKFDFSMAVDSETGSIEAVYFLFRKGRAAKTREFAEGAALADYDKDGKLLGVELLAPCQVNVLRQIGGEEKDVARFMEDAVPRSLVAT
jgi:uncharacterized protein YuzE